jgi:hypothetical protein
LCSIALLNDATPLTMCPPVSCRKSPTSSSQLDFPAPERACTAECGSPRQQPNPPDRVQSAPLFVKASAAERCHSCYELPNPRSYGLFRGGP